MHRGQQALGYRRFGQRQQLRFVQARLRALRLRIEFANGLDLVAKKLDAHRAVALRRIHIQNAATARELPRHLHQVHLRVADAGQMRGEDLRIHLFAALESHRQTGIVVAVKEPQRRRLDRRNQDRHRARGQLPQRRCALLLHIGMRREIFERENVVRRQADHPGRIDGAG